MRRHQLRGRQFGRLFVIDLHDICETPGGTKRTRWMCRCDCGVEKVVRGQDLVTGAIRSCGCFQSESSARRRTTHGQTKQGKFSREYTSWAGAKKRCTNPKDRNYRHYGGRGIRMCDRWSKDFAAFFADMGPCPEGMEIDRVDVNGDYKPCNCRWATLSQQALNKRNTKYVEMFDGAKRPLMEVCREMGVDYFVVYSRLKNGWTLGRAIAAPLGTSRIAA